MKSENLKANILIVDGRPENLMALESLLAEEHTHIFKASSGVDALELLLKYDFALVFIDVQMPDMNGFELAELIRLKEKTRTIPIIFVTAGAIDQKHTFQGYEAGAVDFLYKPLDSRIVKSKVRVFRELEQQKQMIKTQMDQLNQALKSRDEFISIASHELRTPITSIQLQLQILLRGVSDEDKKLSETVAPMQATSGQKLTRSLTGSLRQLKKLVRIIDELLDVSRIQVGKFFVNLERVNLSTLVIENLDNFNDQFLSVKSTMSQEIEPNVWVNCDSVRTEQVIANLLTNAIKYAPGAPIAISLQAVAGQAVLTVKDDGSGIPKEKADRIFDRYERGDNEQAVSGLGLGLYIVKQILEAQQGSVELLSGAGEGATFVVKLPLAKS